MTDKRPLSELSDEEVLARIEAESTRCYQCGELGHAACGRKPAAVIQPEQASAKPTPVEPFTRKLKLTRASDIEIKPVTWMWEDDGAGRIPAGSFAVAAGREGTGKSSFGIWKAAGITTGSLPGSLLGTPYDVIYVAVEDSWEHTIAGRLKAAGADLTRVWRLDVEVSEDEVSTINLPYDFDLLESSIEELGVKLVVLDPLISTIGQSVDTHKERSVRTVLDPLARMADRTGCVMLGIAHFGKGAGTDASSLITGSGAFKNVPRSIFGFAVDPEDGSRVMTQTKNSLGRTDLPSLAYSIESTKILTTMGEYAEVGKFVFGGEAPRSVEQILASNGSEGDRTQDKLDAVDFLKDALDGAWSKTTDIQEEAKQVHGISERTLNRARKGLAVVAKKFPTGKDGKGEWWLSLPEQSANLPVPESEGKGAIESDSEGKGATPNAVTSEDCQGANQGRVMELWHPGTLAPDPEPVDDSPEPVAEVARDAELLVHEDQLTVPGTPPVEVPPTPTVKRPRTVKPKCGWCKKAFAPVRGAAFCSKNCRQNANRASKKAEQ